MTKEQLMEQEQAFIQDQQNLWEQWKQHEPKTRLNAEFIPHMNAWRVYDPKHYAQSVAYVDDEDMQAEIEHCAERGYELIKVG